MILHMILKNFGILFNSVYLKQIIILFKIYDMEN